MTRTITITLTADEALLLERIIELAQGQTQEIYVIEEHATTLGEMFGGSSSTILDVSDYLCSLAEDLLPLCAADIQLARLRDKVQTAQLTTGRTA